MVSGRFPCVRAGKLTEALGIPHDALARGVPPQFEDVYERLYALRCGSQHDFAKFFREHDYRLIHVHNEPNWPVIIAKENQSAPVIMDVHDVTSARPGSFIDPYEEAAYDAADAFVFVTEQQRDFCISKGFKVEGKPYACIGNFASDSTIVERKNLPQLGGVVYAGGADPRGTVDSWRDLSPVADALAKSDIPFNIFAGNPGVDYGLVHGMVMEYRVLINRLSQFGWGFTGVPVPNSAWEHSLPNKVYEYLAAGIPFIALNNPLLKPLCDEGLGIYVDSVDMVPLAAMVDPKPYKKRVLAQRHRFTMSYNIAPVKALYEQLGG